MNKIQTLVIEALREETRLRRSGKKLSSLGKKLLIKFLTKTGQITDDQAVERESYKPLVK